MSPSKGYLDRITAKEGELTFENSDSLGTNKHYVGIDHDPSEDEALAMGRALFDAITGEQAENARRD